MACLLCVLIMPVVWTGAASDGTKWKLTRDGKGQYVTMGTGSDAKKQRVPADGLLEERLVQVHAKLGEPPAELINWLILDGTAPEESTTALQACASAAAAM